MRIYHHFKKTLRNRYFIVFTLLLLWMGVQIGYYGIAVWPESSLQLSSEATVPVSSNEGKPCTSCLNVEMLTNKSAFNFIHAYQSANSSDKKITSMDELVKAYESSSEVKKLIKTLNKGYQVRFHGRETWVKNGRISSSIRACFKGVKIALQKSGITNGDYLKGSSGKDAGKSLKEYGFINLMKTDYKDKIKSPYDCPKGAVIVYSGGHNGHTEICTGSGFMSDYYSKEPRSGSRLSGNGRTVTGIYIKSNDKINNYLAFNERKKEGQTR